MTAAGTPAIAAIIRLAVDLLKRAVDADPKNKSAWNNLGNAYLGQRKSTKPSPL